jgi:hypothetical protein
MKLHMGARGLLAGAMSVIALAGGTGVAQAEPDPPPDPVPGIEEPLPDLPSFFANPANQQIPPVNWDGVGMYCQNLQVTCR